MGNGITHQKPEEPLTGDHVTVGLTPEDNPDELIELIQED